MYIIAGEMTNTCEKLVRIMVENILVWYFVWPRLRAMSLGEIRKGDWIQSREVEFKLDPDRAWWRVLT